MSWFDEVTGTNEYERQSWRDSYNGGRAAGDWTGNVNARIDAERAAYQGATWSGSSSQPSALELARALGGSRGTGVAAGHVTTANPVAVTAGPGSAGARKAGSALVNSAGGAPLTVKINDEATGLMLGGDWHKSNPWFSDANEWENRYAEPGEWVGGLLTMGVDVAYNGLRFLDWGVGSKFVSPHKEGKAVSDFVADAMKSPGAAGGIKAQVEDWFWPMVSRRDGADGAVYHTGGGF